MTTFKWHAATPLTPDSAQSFWESRYQHKVTPWDRGECNPALISWLNQGVLNPGSVLVPGCGRGYEVIELARRGFSVTGLDISPGAISELQSELTSSDLTAELIETDLFNWSPVARFDSIYEQTCLCALLPEQWPAYVRKLSQWLKPGGFLLALFMQTGKAGGPPFHCDLDDMRKLFKAGSWLWPVDEPEKSWHSTGFFEFAVILRHKASE